MIGVIANSLEYPAVREFFELFKTPWEFYRNDRLYDVLLCAGDGNFTEDNADLIVIYASREVPFDVKAKIQSTIQRTSACLLSCGQTRIPIYGKSTAFRERELGAQVNAGDCQSVVHLRYGRAKRVTRIGYDLFHEIRVLLTTGQPVANAGIPALELHIALLRDLIVSSGIRLAEIPPVPKGYRFIACLTHDLDHPSIRRHKFDHTMFGFLYRSVAGSLIEAFKGRGPWRHVLTNWAAALKLPFVQLGWAKDFWLEFGRYTKLEDGLPSSFFVIPFKDSPGRKKHGEAPGRRASRYCAKEISAQIHELISARCEVGLHGIDAWIDSLSGRAELEQIRQITGMQQIGVRMHWLYFDEESPAALENAGADYDSTVGYNETIGYRAGTTQAYKPLETTRLLEVPLHVMDTALFFPCHLGLSRNEAREQVGTIMANAVQFGGSFTVNWHDRSIAPERLWEDLYVDLIADLRKNGAWFATVAQAVSWFRKRRSAVFDNVSDEEGSLRMIVDGAVGDLPALQLRVHNGQQHLDTAIAEGVHSVA
jgi:hypothetical protein